MNFNPHHATQHQNLDGLLRGNLPHQWLNATFQRSGSNNALIDGPHATHAASCMDARTGVAHRTASTVSRRGQACHALMNFSWHQLFWLTQESGALLLGSVAITHSSYT